MLFLSKYLFFSITSDHNHTSFQNLREDVQPRGQPCIFWFAKWQFNGIWLITAFRNLFNSKLGIVQPSSQPGFVQPSSQPGFVQPSSQSSGTVLAGTTRAGTPPPSSAPTHLGTGRPTSGSPGFLHQRYFALFAAAF